MLKLGRYNSFMVKRLPFRVCTHPGCGVLVKGFNVSKCSKHANVDSLQPVTASASNRRQRRKLYNSANWKSLRESFLRENPLCRMCAIANKTVAANTVDHIIPHKGDTTLFVSWDNLQSLCHSCHSYKTATEDGAFGHPLK